MITILGAGGAIGNELVKLFAAKNQPFRRPGDRPVCGDERPPHFIAGLLSRRRIAHDLRRKGRDLREVHNELADYGLTVKYF